MKFDFCIGNPPYNADFSESGDNGKFAAPVYNIFLDAAFSIAEKVEMIHPARFLFNAGSTPKAWNEKMLADENYKILQYEADPQKVFPNTSIMGGVAISYHDTSETYTPIGVFSPFHELNTIRNKAFPMNNGRNLSDIGYSAYAYHFTTKIHDDFPDIKYHEVNGKNAGVLSKGHDFDLKASVFEKLPNVFTEEKPSDDSKYVCFYGVIGNRRYARYIKEAYVSCPDNFDAFKVFMPAANGSPAIGEGGATALIGEPFVAGPKCGGTETFISIGNFEIEAEAQALLKYVKTCFARVLLGVLKTTQHITPGKWKFVPIQDFTIASDIDWSKSVKEIDQQLYKKYGLTDEEINFIETHVKEME